MIKSKNEAMATHFMMDELELKDYRYHYGRTSQPVWAVNNGYYCATKANENPAKHRGGMEFNWDEIKDVFINTNGYKIWESK